MRAEVMNNQYRSFTTSSQFQNLHDMNDSKCLKDAVFSDTSKTTMFNMFVTVSLIYYENVQFTKYS